MILSRVRLKLKKWTEWANLIDSIESDPDGKEFLKELLDELLSTNGHKPLAKAPDRLRRDTKNAQKRLDSILAVCSNFQEPFGLRDLVDSLEKNSFKFRRDDHDVETGAALRKLVGERKLIVVREKVGKVGRLYQRVSP
jgi:hypothetical protein